MNVYIMLRVRRQNKLRLLQQLLNMKLLLLQQLLRWQHPVSLEVYIQIFL